ncbi:MAG: cation:proton antiporter [Candidatus Woesearchaeota archaeon]
MLEQELMSLGILFFFAIVGGVIASKLKQPPVLGLLLVGSLIGPNMFNLVKDHSIIEMMAELGSILLLFVIGLEFVIPKLVKIGFKALMIGILKIGIIFFIIYEVLVFIGINQQAALLIGTMFSVSSTVVIVKVLEQKGLYEREEMPLLIGILLIEDLFAVVVMTFLSGAKSSNNIFFVFEKLIIAITVLVIVYLVFLKIVKIIIPKLLKEGNDELVTFIALGLCAGFSYLAYALGLQPATGAFLAGSIIASLSDAKLFEHAIKPYTLTFTSLFFISIGTMVNFSVIKNNLYLLILLIITIIISRFLALGTMGYLFANFKRQQMIFSSLAMISVGEFSLLIAQAAMKLNYGIDFVSLSAFLIFFTALIMSLTIGYYEKMTDILVTTSLNVNHKPRSFSNFIRLLSEEIDTDNTLSKSLKELFAKSALNFLYLFAIIILFQKTIHILPSYISFTFIHKFITYTIFSLILLILLISIYKLNKQMFKILTRIISNIYSGTSEEQSKNIIKNLLLALLLLLITIFSPLLIVLFKLPNWINIISFLFLVVMIIRFGRLFNIVHNTSKHIYFPKYKKINTLKF